MENVISVLAIYVVLKLCILLTCSSALREIFYLTVSSVTQISIGP